MPLLTLSIVILVASIATLALTMRAIRLDRGRWRQRCMSQHPSVTGKAREARASAEIRQMPGFDRAVVSIKPNGGDAA
ncbi:hypothetical protein GCM10010401_06980 [Rarobacter faecitabidus]|uniref:Uncharacterized protein n=1 Tax=Rarobacter faecitabidus TaxID=13243 RepID=A0A542ZT64_RARFA|nr:hypothetical protein [Rarobacter faecitabidus]TQL63554.1 hypothetical protein FB461_0014 [Rarobacter faecitabidus]